MDISVVVVTYNQQDTVGRTIDSILAQQFDGEFEIIIGDDCSSDATQAVCEDYARRFPDKIRYFRREANMGLVANYFDCIRQAKGRYIADCAGDDFWTDNSKLQRQFDEMQADPEISMVTTDWLCCDLDGSNVRLYPNRKPIGERRVFKPGELLIPILDNSVMPHLCSALYRRDLVMDAVEKYPDMMVNPRWSCEDLQIMVLLAVKGKVVMRPEITTYYSLGHDSVSHHVDFTRRFNHARRVILQHYYIAKFHGVVSQLKDFFANKVDYISALAFHSGNPECRDALQAFKRETSFGGGIKSFIYKIAMQNESAWRILRILHKGRERM